MAAAVAAPSLSSTSASTTVAPASANSLPSAAPWPRAPPVTSATFPANEVPSAIGHHPQGPDRSQRTPD